MSAYWLDCGDVCKLDLYNSFWFPFETLTRICCVSEAKARTSVLGAPGVPIWANA